MLIGDIVDGLEFLHCIMGGGAVVEEGGSWMWGSDNFDEILGDGQKAVGRRGWRHAVFWEKFDCIGNAFGVGGGNPACVAAVMVLGASNVVAGGTMVFPGSSLSWAVMNNYLTSEWC